MNRDHDDDYRAKKKSLSRYGDLPEPDEIEDEGEHLADEFDDDDEDTEDQHHDVVPDGGRVRVGINFMDAMQRSVAMSANDAANHRPGWRVPEQVRQQDQIVSDAYGDYCRWLRDAHRAPVVDARKSGDTKVSPAKRGDAAAAYDEMCAWMRDAHKGQQP